MDPKKRTILVAMDFTSVASYATDHAQKFAKHLGTDVTFLHIIKSREDRASAEKMMAVQVEEFNKKYGVKPETIIRVGSIFSTIGEVSAEIPTELVVMGTHGIRGLQHLTGSWALKVIVTSSVPVIVIQAPSRENMISKIVFPVDFKRENKEKIGWAYYIARMFNSKIYIFQSNYNDVGFKRETSKNMVFTEKFFKAKGLQYEIVKAEGRKSFPAETIEFSQEVNADLMLIMTTKSINFTDYIIGASEQVIIANTAHIPVMCVNPRPSKLGGSFSTAGG
jgi:nucleotide-binding universal stress UspA family protein